MIKKTKKLKNTIFLLLLCGLFMKKKIPINKKVKKILEDARRVIEREDPDWANVSKIIENTIVDIDELISERWCDEL
mgnify:CR=1 FL=1